MSESEVQPRVSCFGGCGKSYAGEDEAAKAGCLWLPVARAWRCMSCVNELLEVSKTTGRGTETIDNLSVHDRGALAKETASTIVEPRVKG